MSVTIIQGPSTGGGITAPTMPTVVSVGTDASTGAGGSVTPGLPSGHTTNDILLLFVQTSGEPPTAPSGYAQIGPRNTASGCRMSVFWKRDGGSEVAPTVNGDGVVTSRVQAVMMAVRGCPTSGDPFFVTSQSVKTVASTSLASDEGAVSIDNSLIVYGIANAISASTNQLSGETNASLTTLTTQYSDNTTDGVGGGISIVTGGLVTAGPIDALTGTWGSSTKDVTNCFAMLPANFVNLVIEPRTCETQMFIGGVAAGTPNDIWTKPTGAKWVEMIAIGPGGGGGNGRNTATAAGGGGGGGGGYTRKVFLATDLPATLSVAPGKGGTGGATANAGGNTGNAGTVSRVFDATIGQITYITAASGTGGAGAASGSGGSGGQGGGRGTAPANTTPATQGLGGQGGGRCNANANSGGGAADEGGGGGATGTGTTSGGASIYGGGGGGCGNTAASSGRGGDGGGTVAQAAGQGTAGSNSRFFTLGGAGGNGGGSGTGTAGAGGFPGGGGGGGGSQSGATGGGNGADGIVVITTFF